MQNTINSRKEPETAIAIQHEKGGMEINVSASFGGDAYWVPLGRPEVNRLIRVLRKARDESFGRDE